jgi:hypothetical protein
MTVVAAKGSSLTPSFLLRLLLALTGKTSCPIIYLFTSEQTHKILFYLVDYNPLVSSFILRVKYSQSWLGLL